MQLTYNTDYSLRVLMYLGTRQDELTSTKDISEYFKISQNHLVKIVNKLGKLGYLTLKRGRYGGGIKLAKSADQINIGEVVCQMEPMDLVECFNSEKDTCRITMSCRLKAPLFKARQSFIEELSKSTLKDLL